MNQQESLCQKIEDTSKELTFKKVLKEEYKKTETYMDQAVNFGAGLLRLFGFWILITTVFCSASALVAIAYNGTSLTFAQLQSVIKTTAFLFGGISLMTILIFNGSGFQNIFSLRARNSYFRQKKIIDSTQWTNELIDARLREHGLIDPTKKIN